MVTRRSYEEGCAAAHALDLVGERWALLVVRELILGPKRFTDLRAGLPGISPNVLTQRLEELEEAAVVHRRKLPPPAGAWVYELTSWGMGLEPVLMALGRWAVSSPAFPLEAPLSVDAFILSLRTMFRPEAAAGFRASLGLQLGEDRFRAEVAGRRLELVWGSAPRPDAVLAAAHGTLVELVYGGRDVDEAIRQGDLAVEGNGEVARRFLTLFPLPPGNAGPPPKS